MSVLLSEKLVKIVIPKRESATHASKILSKLSSKFVDVDFVAKIEYSLNNRKNLNTIDPLYRNLKHSSNYNTTNIRFLILSSYAIYHTRKQSRNII